MEPYEQLSQARASKGWTLEKLRKAARLRCSIVSLSRKLSGKQPISDAELASLAAALGLRVEVTRVSLGAA